MEKRVAQGTGLFQRVPAAFDTPMPEPTGRHLWTVVSIHRIDEPARDQLLLVRENLITVRGPVCLHCDAEWQPALGAKCPGRSA